MPIMDQYMGSSVNRQAGPRDWKEVGVGSVSRTALNTGTCIRVSMISSLHFRVESVSVFQAPISRLRFGAPLRSI